MFTTINKMMPVNDYRPIAKANEEVFRNVLRDIRDNRDKRPRGYMIPKDLETEGTIDALFLEYSAGNRYGKFTICDFTRPSKKSAAISFKKVAAFGAGVELEYLVKPNSSVQYQKSGRNFTN